MAVMNRQNGNFFKAKMIQMLAMNFKEKKLRKNQLF